MLSTLICILSVPDALQPTGPALSSLKPAELTTVTSDPQPRVNSVALLPLHHASAFTAAPVLTEAAVSPSATYATTTKRSKMKVEPTTATSQPQPKRLRASSNTTSKPEHRQAKAGEARLARVQRMPGWLIGAFFVWGWACPPG